MLGFIKKTWFGEYDFLWLVLMVQFPVTMITTAIGFLSGYTYHENNAPLYISYALDILYYLHLGFGFFLAISLWRSSNQLKDSSLRMMGKLYAFLPLLFPFIFLMGVTIMTAINVYIIG